MLSNTPMRHPIASISVAANRLAQGLGALCASASLAAADVPITHSRQNAPPDLLLVVTNASEVRHSGLGRILANLLESVPADPLVTDSWTALANDLGYTRDELFERLLGAGFELLVSHPSSDRGPPATPETHTSAHWAMVARVSDETYQRFRERLKPAPRTVVGSTQILALERGRYELAVRLADDQTPNLDRPEKSPPTQVQTKGRSHRPETQPRGVEIVLGPANRPAVFERLVREVAAKPAAHDQPDRTDKIEPLDWRAMSTHVARYIGADHRGRPSIHLFASPAGLGLLASQLMGDAKSDDASRACEWPALLMNLEQIDATSDRWSFSSMVRQTLPSGTDPTGTAAQIGDCIDQKWTDESLLSVVVPAGFSSMTFTRIVGIELLRQVGLSELFESDRHCSGLLGVRLDVPSSVSLPDEQTVAAVLPSISVLLQLESGHVSGRALERSIASICTRDLEAAGISTELELIAKAASLAPSATHAVRVSEPTGSSSAPSTLSTPTITWTHLPADPPLAGSAVARPTLAIFTYKPTGDLTKDDGITALHNAARACGESPIRAGDTVSTAWRFRGRPADLERLLPERLESWHAARSALSGIAEIDLTFRPTVKPADPSGSRGDTLEVLGKGTIRFAPARHDRPEQQSLPQPARTDR